MKEEKKIMFGSDEAAQYKTLTGWVDQYGRFHGEDKRQAMYSGCTHTTCKCGADIMKQRAKCDECIEKEDQESFMELPVVPYHSSQVYFDPKTEKYYFHETDLKQYLEDEELQSIDLYVCVQKKCEISPMDADFWNEECADQDGDLPEELLAAINAFNERISKIEKYLWWPGDQRTVYTLKS